MLSPEYAYGGDGAKERHEYVALRGEKAVVAAHEIAASVEAFIESGHTLTTSRYSASTDRHCLERSVDMNYYVVEKMSEDFWVYDAASEGIQEYQGEAASCEKWVRIGHYVFSEGPKKEECVISFETHLPYIDKPFVTSYCVEFFTGGTASILVAGENIEAGDTPRGVVRFEREATPFDMEQFKKEYAQAWKHIDAGQNERVIDERLAQPLL